MKLQSIERFMLGLFAVALLACGVKALGELPGPQGNSTDAMVLTGTTLPSNIVNSSLTTLGSSPTVTTPAITFSTSATATAGTNAQAQGPLTSDLNIVTTTAANPSGVTLPTATTGRRLVVSNQGTNAINVYPASAAAIDALGANTALQIAVGARLEFNASSATQWYSDKAEGVAAAAGSLTGTVLASNVVTSSLTAFGVSPTLTTPILGTPTSGTLTNCTGLQITGITTSTSAQLMTLISDETGSGLAVFGTSPTLTTPVINGIITGTGQATAATASTIAMRDASGNLSANNHINGYTTTATAAGTTTLTVTSTNSQYFTGVTTQTVLLPVTSTLALGFQFSIINQSTGVVTVQSSGANAVQAMAGSSTAIYTCILTSGTTAASWSVQYIKNAGIVNYARLTSQNAAVANLCTTTNGAADATYRVAMNINVTTSTVHSFNCEVGYTDETNTARTMKIPMTALGGGATIAINAGTVSPYASGAFLIRCKAGTDIVLRTQAAGTYTTVTFNLEGVIEFVTF